MAPAASLELTQNQKNVVKPQKSSVSVITPQSIVSKAKTKFFKAGGTTQTLSITGTFETLYS